MVIASIFVGGGGVNILGSHLYRLLNNIWPLEKNCIIFYTKSWRLILVSTFILYHKIEGLNP
jgi:hypothetical protein